MTRDILKNNPLLHRVKTNSDKVGKSPKKNPFKSGLKAAKAENARRRQGTTTNDMSGMPRNKRSMSLLRIKPGTRKRKAADGFKNHPVKPLQRKEGFDAPRKEPRLRGRTK